MSARCSTIAAFLAAMVIVAPSAGHAARADIDGTVMREISKCWKPADPTRNYAVVVRFELSRDGSLATVPAVIESKPPGLSDAAIQAALQAVRECTPLKLPPESYDYWRNVQIKFQTQTPGRPFGASAWPQ